MSLNIIVLAAGEGKRMQSRLPKVLHPLAGRSLLSHVIHTARELQPQQLIVVIGHAGEAVRAAFTADTAITWVEQTERLGTGHAVQQALPHVDAHARVLVLYGDVPLMRADTLRALVAASDTGLAILTARSEDAGNYGRIVRNIDLKRKERAMVFTSDDLRFSRHAHQSINRLHTHTSSIHHHIIFPQKK